MSSLRHQQLQHLQSDPLDILVVGGGINGAGILRDLALRAAHTGHHLRAGLVEKGHFASGTSGKNSQLIHGGLRYLKYLQFHLVRESLRERSLLLRLAPQYVQPLEFLLPMYGLKARLMYGTGLSLYDALAGSYKIHRHKTISPGEIATLEPGLTRTGLTSAALFYDGAVHSAQFVVENVLDAIAHGAFAANYVEAESWERAADQSWRVRCRDAISGDRFELGARKIVDARGAWIEGDALRLVRGSHIVIPRVGAGKHAIAHFEPDGRIIFFIPWGSENQLTLVGTTDADHPGSPDEVHISRKERDYLTAIVRKLFPERSDVAPVSAFSSLRALFRAGGRSATATSRDHRIWNSSDGVLHIAGGKYTTYRLMSEQASDLACAEAAPELAKIHRTAETPFPETRRAPGDMLEQHLRDYLFVSTYLGYERRWDAESLLPYARTLGANLGWDAARIQKEIVETLALEPLSAA